MSLLALAWGAGWLASGIGVGRVAPEATLEERERAFEESMRNVVLDGSFTVAWPEPREGVYRDRYEIAGVTKLDGDRWRFDARITYGDVDVTLPVVVPILWAGDVPMIRLVDVEIPGLGSEFGATVLFRRRPLRRHLGPRRGRGVHVRTSGEGVDLARLRRAIPVREPPPGSAESYALVSRSRAMPVWRPAVPSVFAS